MKLVTIYGVVVLVLMMAAYAFEGRGRRYVLAFALGCALSSSYGFLSGTWPFGGVEAIWCLVVLRRYASIRTHPDAGDGHLLDRKLASIIRATPGRRTRSP